MALGVAYASQVRHPFLNLLHPPFQRPRHMDYTDLIRFISGRPSGWRVDASTTNLKASIAVLEYENMALRLHDPRNRRWQCTLRQVGAGIPLAIETNGADHVQRLVPAKLNKVLDGPWGGGVEADDINGMFGALSLGLSTEGAQNVSIVFFGDWGTGISLLSTGLPPLALLSQIGLATAVLILPTGLAGIKFWKGHADLFMTSTR